MTCVEKLKADRPGIPEDILKGILTNDCPDEYGYHRTLTCGYFEGNCHKCWNSEVEEPKEETKLIYAHTSTDTVSEKSTSTPVIKDSGNRREFESGAVRDMQEGKGRCDLMPLEVVAHVVNEVHGNPDYITNNVALFQKSRNTTHLYNALERFASIAFNEDNLGASCCTMCLEVAKHFEEGAKKYGENNWQKGIPPKCYIDSAMRHYIKWRRGDKDEPHDRAFCWNLMCCIWEVDHHVATIEKET